MKSLINQFNDATGISYDFGTKLLISLLIFCIAWILGRLLTKLITGRIEGHHANYKIRKVITYILYFFAFLIVARIWFQGIESLTTLFGIFSAGLAIALKDPISDIAAWLFLIVKRPLEVGDRVEINSISGDVIDIRVFQFTLLEINNWAGADQSTGRIVHMPNSLVFNKSIANYSKGFKYIWNEIRVTITFESNWRKAKGILENIAKNHTIHLTEEAGRGVKEASQKFMIFYNHLTPIVYTEVANNGVVLTIRHLCEPRNRRDTSEKIWEDVLDMANANEDIDLAYLTQRLYHAGENKKSTE